MHQFTSGRVVGFALALGFLLTAACQETIYLQTQKFDELVVLGASPARKVAKGDGTVRYEPICRGGDASADLLLLHVLLQGTLNKADEKEQDVSIKPGDKVDMGKVTLDNMSRDLFDLELSCLEETSGEPAWGDECTGVQNAPFSFDGLDFFRYGGPDNNRGTVALAILIDMSGSMKGLTIQSPPYNEDSDDKVFSQLGVDFAQIASDRNGSRIAAVRSLIQFLNPEDRLLVLSFNEEMVDVVCSLEDGFNEFDYDGKKENCFGMNRSLVVGSEYGPSALDSLQGEEKGRTPLWLAVRDAYEFLEKNPKAQEADFRHIVVVGDGPDTCGKGAESSQCSEPCVTNLGFAESAFDEFLEELESKPFEDRIPVHFVQIQAKGYRERDPRQQEVACMTGGHYRFLNFQDLPEEKREGLIRDSLLDIRHTFRGYWRFAVQSPLLESTSELMPGRLYVVGGNGTVLPGDENLLTQVPRDFQFMGMTEVGYEDFIPLDNRPSFRLACKPGNDGQCPPVVDEGECSVRKSWCDEQTLTCLSALEWKPDGEESGCTPQMAVLEVEVKKDGGQSSGKEISLGLVPTVCCMGECRPPNPPKVPIELARPESGGAACFWYDEGKGWARKYSFNTGGNVWGHEATAKDGGDCDWAAIKAQLMYADLEALSYPDDWACGGVNCFAPPAD